MSDRLPERIVDIAASLEVACARLSQNAGSVRHPDGAFLRCGDDPSTR